MTPLECPVLPDPERLELLLEDILEELKEIRRKLEKLQAEKEKG